MNATQLPRRDPFFNFFSIFGPKGVVTCTSIKRLKECRPAERMLIDVLADEVLPPKNGHIAFTYSLENWEKLCNALGEMSPENDLSAIGRDNSAGERINIGWPVTMPIGRQIPKGGAH